MDDEAVTPPTSGPGDAGAGADGVPPIPASAPPKWAAIGGEVPAPSVAQTEPTASEPAPVDGPAEPVAPTEPVRPPWWAPPQQSPSWTATTASTTTTTPTPTAQAIAPMTVTSAPRRGTTRTVLLAALVGALVAALVTGGLFSAFHTDNDASSPDTTPLAVTGANSKDTVPLLPGGGTAMNIRAVLARIQPAVVRIKITTADGSAAGTGIVIDPNGTVVTNAHVVEGADTIQVQLPNGDIAPGTAKGVDPTHDLAVVTIPRHGLESAVLGDSDALNVGDPVIAVGNALDLGISVTTGIVSAIDRDVPEENGNTLYGALQTDAAINPGNSGGPLVNARGEVVGINTAIAPPTDANNVGFAIAISAAKPIIADLSAGRAPHDALLGVTSQDVTPQLVSQHHLKVTSGAYVEQVDASTAAARAGITRGDVIVSLDGRPVTTTEQMRRYIRRHQPGDKVQVVYVQPDGTRKTATATLGAN